MRTDLPAILVLLALGSSAEAATRNFGVTGYERVRVEGPFRVQLKTGVAPFAKASGNLAALDAVSVTMQGRTLVLRADRNARGNYPGGEQGPVEVSLGTHDLQHVSVTGSGSLDIDKVKGLEFGLSVQGSGIARIGKADVDQLKINLAGSAAATLGGKAGKLTASVRGVSTLDADGLATKNAKIGADGPATVRATVTNEATVTAAGAATVALAGGPACTNTVKGSASVTGCRAN